MKSEKQIMLDIALNEIETIANYPFRDHNLNTLLATREAIKKAKELVEEIRKEAK